MGKILRAIDDSKSIRIYIANTKDIVEEMRRIHTTSRTATAALGRLTSLASILSLDLKNEDDSLTLRVNGDGPSGSLVAVSYGNGTVKSYIQNPKADLPSRSDGKLDVGGLVGKNGRISLVRDYGMKEPYVGVSNIVSGEIAEDFAYYFYTSEQTNTVLSLGVFVDKDLSVSRAGGIFLQVLPNPREDALDRAERIVNSLPQVTKILEEGLTNREILDKYFSDLNPEFLSEDEVIYKCNCSREKIYSTLKSINRDEIDLMLKEDKKIEVHCQFCNRKYVFYEDDFKD